jgi:hypothetical protein
MKNHLIFHDFSPYGITTFTASSVLQGIRSSLLRLHTLRLEAAMKLAIADFRFYALTGVRINRKKS